MSVTRRSPPWMDRPLDLLASFRIEAWAALPVLAVWLLLALLDRAYAASNAVLVLVVGAIACLVGGRLGELRVWPATVLVPGYGQSLFLLCLAAAGSATALGALWSWWLGNPMPAIGPALLIALAATVVAMRIPAALTVVMVLSLGPVFALFLGVAFSLGYARSFDLSDVWTQLGALGGAGLIALRIRRSLVRPVIRPRHAGQPPVGFGRFPTEDLKVSAVSIGGTLCVLVALWYWLPHWLEFCFLIVWLGSFGNVLLSWWFTVHVQLSRDWTFGIAEHRKELGRRAAVRLVWISLPWLVLGTAFAVVHAIATNSEYEFLLDDVLIIQSVTVASFVVLCGTTRRLPPSRPLVFFAGVPWIGLTGAACIALTFLDYTAWAHAVLVLAVIGAGALAVVVGGPALARAEILREAPIANVYSTRT